MKRIIYFVLLLVFSSSVFAAKFTVSPVKTSYNNIFTDKDDNLVQSVYSDNGMEVVIGAQIQNEKLKYNIQLNNVKDLSFLKRTNSIRTYYGNIDTDEWTENTESAINQISMDSTKIDESISPEQACVIAGASCLCALTLYEICNSTHSSPKAINRSSSTTRRSNTRRPSVKRAPVSRVPSFSWIIIDPIITIDNSSSSGSNRRSVQSNNQIIPAEGDLIPNNNLQYAGSFLVPIVNAPDYRVRVIVSDSEFIDFYFSRSDRNIIANPLKDRNYGRHSLTFSCNIPYFDRFGGYYIYSGKKVGLYLGTTLSTNSKNIEEIATYKPEKDQLKLKKNFSFPNGINKNDVSSYRLNDYIYKDTLTDYFNFNAGLTIKTFPYTWLMLGGGIEFTNEYHNCTVEGIVNGRGDGNYLRLTNGYVLTEFAEVAFVPQIGLNFIIGNLDLATMFQYSYIMGPCFDIMLGISF